MHITRTELATLTFPYAVSIFDLPQGPRAVVATELPDRCLSIGVDDLTQEVIWDHNGGTMNVWQINDRGDFFAVQETFKGFNSKNAGVAKVTRDQNGTWTSGRFFSLPYLHRFCMVDAGGEQVIIASSLCSDKASREDWSHPGTTYLVRLPDDLSTAGKLEPLIEGVHTNHGMFIGHHRGKQVVMISGLEGVFEIHIPEKRGGEWRFERILEKDVSDMVIYDFDGDGVEEMITIEGFHGRRMVINKPTPDGGWREIYAFPIEFGHCLWAGTVFGKPSIFLGYRQANAALVMFQLREMRGDDPVMDVTVIDEHEGPTNFAMIQRGDVFKIFTCSTARDRVVLYELRE